MQEAFPRPAFSFKVVVGDSEDASGASFQEVSGIETEASQAGGDTFIHKLPKTVKHPTLHLKRGVVAVNSPFMEWCRAVLEGNVSSRIKTSVVTVYLLDESSGRIGGWSFTNAYPVAWQAPAFGSAETKIAIEDIEIVYEACSKML